MRTGPGQARLAALCVSGQTSPRTGHAIDVAGPNSGVNFPKQLTYNGRIHGMGIASTRLPGGRRVCPMNNTMITDWGNDTRHFLIRRLTIPLPPGATKSASRLA